MVHIRTAVIIAALAFIIFTIPVLAQPAANRPEIWLSNLHMLDARTGWAQSAEGWSGNFAKGAFGSVVRTTDGGVQWKDVRPASLSAEKLDGFFLRQALTSHIAWAEAVVPNPSRSLLFRTVDGGQTWKYVTLPQDLSIRSLSFINSRDGWLISWNDIYRSADSGATWSKIGRAELSRHPVRITFSTTTTGWISGFSGNGTDGMYQLVTSDGGRTWHKQILPLPAKFTSQGAWLKAGAPQFFSATDGVLIIGYRNDIGSLSEEVAVLVYLTRDAGESWTYTTPLIWKTYRASGSFVTGFASASFADTNHGWVTDTQVLYRTRDGGRTWTRVRPGAPFGDTTELEFISPQEGWTPGVGFHPPYLLKTVDGGRTWKDLSFSISR